MSEPSLDAAIAAAVSRDGWAFFEHAADPERGAATKNARNERNERAAAHLARLHASDPAFRDVLETLLDATHRRQTFTAALGLDPMQAYAFGVFREGQNALMEMILKMIASGRKEQPERGREP